jgi:hypothetical protein
MFASEGYYHSLLQQEPYTLKSEATRYATQMNEDTCNMDTDKTWIIFLFTMQDVLNPSMAIPEPGLLHLGLTYTMFQQTPKYFCKYFKNINHLKLFNRGHPSV